MSNLPSDKVISCFYDSSTDCVKVVDTDGMLLSFNPNGLIAMEIDDEKEVLGKDWLSFWNDNMRDKAETAFDQARNGKLSSFEGYCPTFKGTVKYWEVSIAPLFDDNKDVQWLLVTSKDMTVYKDLEKLVVAQKKEIDSLKSKLLVISPSS